MTGPNASFGSAIYGIQAYYNYLNEKGGVHGRKIEAGGPLDMQGGAGDDDLLGGPSADRLEGGPGRDSLVGADGGDFAIATGTDAADADTISLGAGADTLFGAGAGTQADLGADADLYVFIPEPTAAAATVDGGTGNDRIMGYPIGLDFKFPMTIDLASATAAVALPGSLTQAIKSFEHRTSSQS